MGLVRQRRGHDAAHNGSSVGGSRASRIRERLTQPVDGSSLALFRVAFGLVVVWEVYRFFDHGWIRRYYIDPDFHFTYLPFGWVTPWPGAGMTIHFLLLALAGGLVAAGLFYRPAAVALFAGISYVFLLDKARYLNHVYLMCLIAFVLAVIPAARTASLDALRRQAPAGEERSDFVPTWALWLLRFQVGAPYVLGGIAKINHDWLIRAEPLRDWLQRRDDFPLVGGLFWREDVIYGMAWGSMLLDLLTPFLMLHRRTRVPVYAAVVTFHLMNDRLFRIGIFPWMMILATTIFFRPDFPRRMLEEIRVPGRGRAAASTGFVVLFAVGAWLPRSFSLITATIAGIGGAILVWHLLHDWLEPAAADRTESATPQREAHGRPILGRLALAGLVAYVALQVLVPLRHFVIPGEVSWTEEGHRFAWHMKLRDKDALDIQYHVTDAATGRTWSEFPQDLLAEHQFDEMRTRPDMILHYAHHLERLIAEPGKDVQIRADVRASLNGRPSQRLIDPFVDLTTVDRWALPPAKWLVPLEAD